MKFEGGRGKPEPELEMEDSLEKKMMMLAERRLEMKAKIAQFKKETKHLKDIIKSLENTISAEVAEMHQTVTVGNIRAEYIPVVKFQMLKETKDEQ